MKRYSVNLNINQNIGKRIMVGFNLNAGYIIRSGVVTASTNNGQGRAGVVTSAVLFAPVQPVRHQENNDIEAGLGILYDEDGRMIANQQGDVANPVAMLENNTNSGVTMQGRFNMFVDYKIANGIQFKSSLRGYASDIKNKSYFSEKIGWTRSIGGSATTNFSNMNSLVAEQNLSYSKKFGKNSINAILVSETQLNNYEYLQTTSQGFDLPGLNLDNLQSALVTLPVISSANTSTIQSYLTRINFDALSKYLITVSARTDGSSRFAAGKQWGFFPSVGLAWRLSSEKFMKNATFVSDAKIKASYGETGNNEIGSYRSLARAGLANYIFNGSTLAKGAAINSLANSDLTWETTKQTDLGISLTMFKSRLNIEADIYNKNTTDLLLEVPLPATSGYTTSFKNLGLVNNKGLELSFTGYILDKGQFKWKSTLNISFNRNKIMDLGVANEFFVTSIGDNQIQNDYIVRVGESLGSIYGLKNDGVYTFTDFVEFDGLSDADAAAKMYSNVTGQENWYSVQMYNLKPGVVKNALVADGKYRPGMSKFVDHNKDGIINDEDRHIIGNTQPKHFGGFLNEFSYKNFKLSIQSAWSYGNNIYNKNIKKLTDTASPWANKLAIINDRWDPEHPNNTLTSFNSGASGNFNSAAYSMYIEDGSYFRISNITLNYQFSKKIASSVGIKGARIYASVDNAFLFTNYTGWDPDVSVGNNQLTPGLDVDSYPRARTYTFGLNINL
jgi:TonB-linked SusC/RagA family outer membrane protein